MSEIVKIISDTAQEFQGERYYRCGNYFQRKGRRLHVAVWEFLNGPVPHGWHVHHKDENKANNRPDNLEALPKAVHLSHHMREPARREHSRKIVATAIKKAPEWHRSEAGREWHREHFEKTTRAIWHAKVPKKCGFCRTDYEVIASMAETARFCSNKCKAAARRASGVDDEMRTCEGCGQEFSTNRYSKATTCSPGCRWSKRRAAASSRSNLQV